MTCVFLSFVKNNHAGLIIICVFLCDRSVCDDDDDDDDDDRDNNNDNEAFYEQLKATKKLESSCKQNNLEFIY